MTMRRTLALSSLLLCFGLAACGGGASRERRAEADYLQDRGEALEDAALSSKVAAAIMEDRHLSGMKIHVKTYNNIVHLTGYVESRSDVRHAEERAMTVNGVRGVDNRLVVD
ncbi:MAG: BON domain-containing protein [Rhodospirillaceae bacterium]|nr:BON domain-containing protein [Rhodospirillaceae bacterium]